MTDFSGPTKVRNVSGRELCSDCVDGWVELRGTVTIGGHTYSRGWAPCKRCEQGVKRFIRATEPDPRDANHRSWEPETRFQQPDDIVQHSLPRGRTQRDVRAQLRLLPRLAPVGDPGEAIVEDPGFAERRRLAESGLREMEEGGDA